MTEKNSNDRGATAPFSVPHRTDYDAYKALAWAIIWQAVQDYKLGSPQEHGSSKRFFLSERFTILSGGMDGQELLDRLDKIDKQTFRRAARKANLTFTAHGDQNDHD